MNLRKIYYFLTPELRLLARRAYFLPKDMYTRFFRNQTELLPPQGLIFIGGGDFRSIGKVYLKRFIELGNLKPGNRVLDIGCGVGRIAIPLTSYLKSDGSYEGFDIVKSGIDWCNKRIKPNFPNFNFIYINLKNSLYNSHSDKSARDFKFPYKDNEFDFVILTSVFTHMLPPDMDNYLKEIYRVLKFNGVCYTTFFLLNNDTKISMVSNDGLNFIHNHGDYRVYTEGVEEANVAYEETTLLEKYFTKNQLKVEKIFYGFWSGRSRQKSLDFQDTIILSKST